MLARAIGAICLFGLLLQVCRAGAQVKKTSIVHLGTPRDTTKNPKKAVEYTSSIEERKVDRDTSYLQIGGALRFNYINTRYESGSAPLGTPSRHEFTMDTWRLNVNAEAKGVLLSFEYRFYPTFNTHFMHQGWIGYKISNHTQVQVGISQVPFGNLKYASHSWWF